jgi:hypothetical protein
MTKNNNNNNNINTVYPASNNNTKKIGIIGAVAAILAAVFALEGGYVNHPNDPGGETNHGVTVAVARQAGYTGRMIELKRNCDYPIVLPEDMKHLVSELERREAAIDRDGNEKCAAQILFEGYIEKPGYMPLIIIDYPVAKEVIDTAVNMGPARSSRFFKRAVNEVCNTNLPINSNIDNVTVKAWKDCRVILGSRACVSMLNSLDRQQKAEYDRLITVNPRLRVFYRGWINHRIGNVNRNLCGKISV